MGIISYAQNFEDVLLWRALGHIEHGFYVDIGAQDPVVDSVSLAFYEHGWHGIHVEPVPHYAELLRERRPGDTVIQAAVGKKAGVMRFFEIPGTGISTADPEIAQQHRERGFDVRESTVPSIRLESIFEQCPVQDIHWLKIDVEGFEGDVLSGWGKSTVRPWIIIVESTLPLTQIQVHERWDALIIKNGYGLVYFDGLNRYYVSDAHPELKPAFSSPPNVFDGFALNGTSSSPFHKRVEDRLIAMAAEAAAQFEERLRSANADVEDLKQRERGLNARLEERNREFSEQLARAEREAREAQAESTRVYLEREQVLRDQLASDREELAGARAEAAARERTFAADLERVQREAREAEAESRHLYVKREQDLKAELASIRDELAGVRDEAAGRERMLTENLARVRREARDAETESCRVHLEREQILRHELASVRDELAHVRAEATKTEMTLSGALRELQEKARNEILANVQALVERERDFAETLVRVQKDARDAEAEGRRAHLEREQELAHEHALTRDELSRSRVEWAQQEHALRAELASLIERERNVRAMFQAEAERAARLTAELDLLKRSVAWRLTFPLRWLAMLFGGRDWSSGSLESSAKGDEVHEITRDDTDVQASLPDARLVATPPPNNSEEHAKNGKQAVEQISAAIQERYSEAGEVAMKQSMYEIESVGELLALHDAAFVEATYHALLGRGADPEGMRYYLGRLRAGHGKGRIIAQIAQSPEGKTRHVNLGGLNQLLREEKSASSWLGGLLFRGRRMEKQICLLENELGRVTDVLVQLKQAMDHRHGLDAYEMHVREAGVDTPETAGSAALNAQPATMGQSLGAHAKLIYARLMRGAGASAKRSAA